MIWVCFAATGPGHLAVIDLVYKSSVYQSIQTLPVSHLHTGNSILFIQRRITTMVSSRLCIL